MKKTPMVIMAAVLVILAGVIIIARPFAAKKERVDRAPASVRAEKGKVRPPAKKAISKGMGGLNVTVINSKGKEAFLKAKAFSVIDSRSSIYAATLTTNRVQELAPGSYDIEVDTIPQKIYKNIKVVADKENFLDLGCPTGSVTVKALNSKKKDAAYLMRVVAAKSNILVAAGTTNRPLEVMPGVYDIEIDIVPRLVKRGVRLEAGKETVVDLGVATGSLTAKVLDENGKQLRYTARIRNASNNEMVSSGSSNRATELQPGTYNIEVLTNPVQTRKGVSVMAGEAAAAEFIVQLPAPRNPVPPPQAKKR